MLLGKADYPRAPTCILGLSKLNHNHIHPVLAYSVGQGEFKTQSKSQSKSQSLVQNRPQLNVHGVAEVDQRVS